MTKISTFAVSTMGWTEDLYDSATYKMMSLHKGSCYVHFSWDDSRVTDPVSIAMYQSLAYLGAPPTYYPWEHTDDSGFGHDDKTSPDLGLERGIKFIGPGPYTALHLFGSTSPDVIYCILEYAPGLYRHFAFGNVEKYGTWTGGEFVAGHQWYRYGLDSPTANTHSILFDGSWANAATSTSERSGATVHCEGLPNQDGAGKWGAVGFAYDMNTAANLLDRAGEDMLTLYGGVRGGPALWQLGWQEPDVGKGYIPIIPVDLYYLDESTSPDNYYFMGRLAHMGHIQLRGIDPNTTITIGADTWRAFPAVRKSKVGGGVEESWDMGLIYKQ
ncbi:MAG: hypothetical protein GY934_05080 [Gammaproteobacteria bacterium]|nr:hypothetical protein [Gammaproteobacteria bacterium]